MSFNKLISLTFFFIALGFGAMMAGFWYDVMNAGIPYQDAPPELLAEYQAAQNTAVTLFGVGALFSTVGALLAIGTAALYVHRLLRPTVRE
jgi:hypothetical protein